jgi:hypothetical protein
MNPTDEQPLRELVRVEIFMEYGGVLDLGETTRVGCNRVV